MDYQRNTVRQSYGRERRTQDISPTFAMQRESQIKKPGDAENCFFGKSLAMVYSPYQFFENIYGTEEGFSHGTIFRELDKPLNIRRDC